MPSTAYASTPLRCNASRQLRPESSDTSRSEDVPPIKTATRPKSLGLVMRLVMEVSKCRFLPNHSHFRLQFHPMPFFNGAHHVRNQLFDVRCLRGTVVDDEV